MNKPVLRAEGLELSFSGVKAADNVNLEVREGEFLAIIGSNGSGKTTFLNMCTGYLRPESGKVYLGDAAITGMAPRRIARRGIARAFQIPQLFTDQTLLTNVMLAIASRRGIFQGLRRLDRTAYIDEAHELLALFSLEDHAETIAGTLPEGLRKLADITLALALNPRLLLLDEPTSGVSALERFTLMEKLMAALKARQMTALFVEHDMEIVTRYADRVVVWDAGRIIAEGDPKQVLRDPQVIERVVGAV
ncbi:ABC transporter ATP-binding protein [Pseudohoeflea coraliihabitans]|uniref:ATP-binding cassette domain-containing protein n=1 Tax=Pseudohoeflea coraliihabitans TaxID=2860393 RepID=A0ABS6WQC9_9HYPH|nr:ATP-binding cassette domain-containing protein [Pseudohoeflea sp. DP4N28-3]MBW3098156.1 ATP-binding cassette domain-containing protein [Pseudohoeflea sp. DP4N28-3]